MTEGILLVNKPVLYTSHDIVDFVRRKFGMRRVGHAGTLDPMATGLLVVLIGRSTSLFERFVKDDKEYRGVMTLGMRTDTQDLEGKIIEEKDPGDIDAGSVLSTLGKFTGRWEQQTPRFSSVKVGGAKCYAMARRNAEFETPKRAVEIKSLTLEGFLLPDVYFRVHCSKGTYVRALCEEIGASLGTGAVLSGLERIRSGDFHLSKSVDLSQIRSLPLKTLVERLILPSGASIR